MDIFISWLVSAVVIFLLAYFLPGITLSGFLSALLVAIVLGVINAVIKPVLLVLALPINIFTLGLFTLVINALLIMLVAYIVPGFQVTNFWWALLFGIVLSAVMFFIGNAKTTS